MQTLGLADSTPRSSSRLKDLFWPDLSNEVSSLTVCHSASGACFVIAGMTALVSLFVSYAALLDAALFALIGLGLRKGSRTAAVAGLLLYLAEIVFTYTSGQPPSVVAFFITVILFNSVRASFAYQKFRKNDPPPLPVQPTS